MNDPFLIQLVVLVLLLVVAFLGGVWGFHSLVRRVHQRQSFLKYARWAGQVWGRRKERKRHIQRFRELERESLQ